MPGRRLLFCLWCNRCKRTSGHSVAVRHSFRKTHPLACSPMGTGIPIKVRDEVAYVREKPGAVHYGPYGPQVVAGLRKRRKVP